MKRYQRYAFNYFFKYLLVYNSASMFRLYHVNKHECCNRRAISFAVKKKNKEVYSLSRSLDSGILGCAHE